MAPIWVTTWRLILGTAILWGIMLVRGEALPSTARDWLGCAWLAIFGNLLPFWLISWGTQYIPSGLSGILMAAVPLVVMVLAAFLLPDEPMTGRKFAGFIAGFAGVVLLIGPGALVAFDLDNLHLIGALAVLTATLGYAAQAVSVRLMRPMSGLRRATGVLIIATAAAIVVALIADPGGYWAQRPQTLGAVLALGLFPTALASIILFPLLVSAGASFTALTNYLVPVFALGLGVAFLGETFALADLAGLGLILAGIGIARARKG